MDGFPLATAAWAGVFANLAAAIFIFVQAKRMSESIKQGRLQTQIATCIEVWKQYNEVFSDRQRLLRDPVSLEVLLENYTSIDDLVDSEDYKCLRRVATVYGMAAALIRAGAVTPHVLFTYISVPPKLWDDHWPLVKYIREGYYEHLFAGWEELDAASRKMWKPRRSEAESELGGQEGLVGDSNEPAS